MRRAWHDPGIEQVPGAWGGVGDSFEPEASHLAEPKHKSENN